MNITEEEIESLRTVANADCSVSYVAETILEHIGEDTLSHSTATRESTVAPNTVTKDESEKGILAY